MELVTRTDAALGESLLVLAIIRGHVNIASALIDAGADLHAPVEWRAVDTLPVRLGSYLYWTPYNWTHQRWATVRFGSCLELAADATIGGIKVNLPGSPREVCMTSIRCTGDYEQPLECRADEVEGKLFASDLMCSLPKDIARLLRARGARVTQQCVDRVWFTHDKEYLKLLDQYIKAGQTELKLVLDKSLTEKAELLDARFRGLADAGTSPDRVGSCPASIDPVPGPGTNHVHRYRWVLPHHV